MALAAVKTPRRVPSVLVCGEIYVRCDPFANGEVARALERRGLRVRLEPVTEFIQYTDWVAWKRGWKKGLVARLDRWLRDRILDRCHAAAAGPLGLPAPPPIGEAVAAAGAVHRPPRRGGDAAHHRRAGAGLAPAGRSTRW